MTFTMSLQSFRVYFEIPCKQWVIQHLIPYDLKTMLSYHGNELSGIPKFNI